MSKTRLVIWRKNKETGYTKQLFYADDNNDMEEHEVEEVAGFLNCQHKSFEHYVLKIRCQ